jgi:hypothetical protein
VKVFSKRISIVALALVLISICLLQQSTPAKADDYGCLTTLPLKYSLSSYYAASWVKTLDVYVVPQDGVSLQNLDVSISTFSGQELGSVVVKGSFSKGQEIKIKLKYPMQEGKFSLYFKGSPNANPDCGPKHLAAIIKMTGCGDKLPVKIIDTTEGYASSYGNYYSFGLESVNGQLLKNLKVSMASFGGQELGKSSIPVLFGTLKVNLPISSRIYSEKYSITVSGYPPQRPVACGTVSVEKTVRFR